MGALGTKEGVGLAFLRTLSASDDCIEYPFGRFKSTGYGRVRSGGRPRPAHVVAFELHVGPVPEGLEVCHNCGNRPCVNPTHLRADTHRSNMADCVGHGTHTRGERNGRARLTADDARRVREEALRGKRQIDLAAETGVSPKTINHVVRGRTWATDR